MLLLQRRASIAARSAATRWRAAGADVHCVSSDTPAALVAALDSEAWSGIALWSPDAVLEHALARSLRQASTPVTVFFEQDEHLEDARRLEVPFSEPPLPARAPEPEVDLALRRLGADPRVMLVFRSAWHQRALATRLGLEAWPRSVVIAASPSSRSTGAKPSRRIFFPGALGLARAHGADLFVRSALEVSKRATARPEFVIDAEAVEDERVLAPLADLPTRLLANEALATSPLALVTQRNATALQAAIDCLAHGVLPLVLEHPAIAEQVPGVPRLPDDPGAWAVAALALLDDEPRREELVRTLHAALPADQAARELACLDRETPASPPTQPRPSPLLTVAVPAYNAARYLERCVRSLVIAPGSEALEVLVVDDGSTDDTAAVAHTLERRHPGVVRLVRQENRGHGGALNTALAEARGRWFRVVDADDWVDPLALGDELAALEGETADLVLTDYAEDRPDDPLPRRVDILSRLPPGGLVRFDSVLDPLYGLTSWGPLLSTSTFRTEQLRRAGVRMTERSAYVDLEYCTFALQSVETLRYLPRSLYRYALHGEGQTVSAESYRKRFREHEGVIVRLCRFVESGALSPLKRRYVIERVIAPVVVKHLEILAVLDAQPELEAFLAQMKAFGFVPLPPSDGAKKLAAKLLRAALPAPLAEALARQHPRSARTVLEQVGLYTLPAAISRYLRG